MSVNPHPGNEVVLKYNRANLERMQDITSPLKDYLGIQNFSYMKYYPDGRYFHLSKNGQWAEFFLRRVFENGKYFQMANKLSTAGFAQNFQWPEAPGDHLMDALYDHKIWHGFNMYETFGSEEKGDLHFECITFATHRDHGLIRNFYEKNTDTLRDFIVHFKTEAKDMLENTPEGCFATYGPKSPPKAATKELPTREEIEAFYRAIGMTPPVRVPDVETLLTELELTVFKHYGQGHAIKEVAYRMEVPEHVVKNALERLKNKLGMRRKVDLVWLYQKTFA